MNSIFSPVNRIGAFAVALMLVLALGACGGSEFVQESDVDLSVLDGQVMEVYYNSSCTCCGEWVEYIRQYGVELTTVVDQPREHAEIKRQHGISQPTQSCHTAIIDGYVVEGHIPGKIVAKLLHEQPAIAGISIPGMPQHAPGMGDRVGDELEIIAIDRDGIPTDVYAKVRY